MKKIIVFSFLILIVSCQSNQYLTLKNDVALNSVFSSEEVKDLVKILAFFDQHICGTKRLPSNKKLQNCYKTFFQNLSSKVNENSIDLNIPFEKQLQLHEQLKETVQDDIWFKSRTTRHRMRLDENSRANYYPDTFTNIVLTSEGKYGEFIRQFSEENEQMIHGISPILFSDVLENYRSYDISDNRIRLIIAIHYLTINYQHSMAIQSEKKLDELLKSE